MYGDKDQLHPVHRVLQDTELLSHIFEICAEEYTARQVYSLDRYTEPHPLRHASLVNRIFRNVASGLIFAQITFEAYERYNPANAPDETLAKIFSHYRSHTKMILFDSLYELQPQLPLLVKNPGSLRYLKVADEEFSYLFAEDGSVQSKYCVDLRKRIIKIPVLAELIGKGNVHIKSIQFDDSELDVEDWPEGFRIVRSLVLTVFDPQNMSGYQMDTQDVSDKPLDDILSQGTTGTVEFQTDSEEFIHLTVYSLDDLSFAQKFLPHPPLEKFVANQHRIRPSEVLVIIQQASTTLRSMAFSPEHFVHELWSADEVYRVILAFVKSSVRMLNVILDMSVNVWGELQRLLISDQQIQDGSGLEIWASLPTRTTVDASSTDKPTIDSFKEVLPGWRWLSWKHADTSRSHRRLVLTIRLG